jgi:hypothetical protein
MVKASPKETIMRLLSPLILAACLSGCGQQPANNATEPTAHHGGRYLGIGVYPASDLWQHLAAPNRSADPHAATLEDDTQLIVVVDSNSGEIRQCGNMSGHCIGMNPWAAALGQGRAAPVALDAHQADLDREARENNAASNAAVEDVAAHATRSRRR